MIKKMEDWVTCLFIQHTAFYCARYKKAQAQDQVEQFHKLTLISWALLTIPVPALDMAKWWGNAAELKNLK